MSSYMSRKASFFLVGLSAGSAPTHFLIVTTITPVRTKVAPKMLKNIVSSYYT